MRILSLPSRQPSLARSISGSSRQRSLTRSIAGVSLLAALLGVSSVALAQPSEPPPSATGTGSGSGSATDDDPHLREMVDREVAKLLNERAVKDAADRAAREQSDKDAQPAAPSSDDISGSSGFMDTRLAFTVTNENILVKPGETIPSVPGWRFGVPNSLGVLFFDNYDTRYSGFETLSHAVMYRDFRRGHFQAEAGFVFRINELSGNNIALSDDGSYITLSNWKDPTHKDPTRLSLTVFPVSADRFRLGYSYRLSWGGDPEYGRAQSATPGMKVQYDTGNAYVFAGAKSAIILDTRTAEQRSALAFLAGAGIDPTSMVRIEVNGGYFDRGYNQLVDVNDQKVQLFGGSAQIAIHKGMPVQSSVDYRLFKNNNERVSGLFDPVKYPGGVSWLVMSEITTIGQTLKDPEKTGSTKIQYGKAGDINVRMTVDRVRLRFDASFRDLAFVLHSVPSLPTYEDFPKDYKVHPDFFAAVGADKNWNDFVTVGLIAGIDVPASLESPASIPGGSTSIAGSQTAVIRNNNIDTIITILPAACNGKPCTVATQFALKGSIKLNFGRIYSALFEMFYSYDPNTTRYLRTAADAPFQYQFANFNQLGLNATLQARF
ncbi:MAG: hypothetical protein JWO36_5362 [Myxococcales bacterium]|nr:hypothetical protein [Myxococcales bacterium]